MVFLPGTWSIIGQKCCRSWQEMGCDLWATLPVEAGPAATAAPAAGSNIPEGLSSPAALAQRLRNERLSANGGGRSEGRRPRAAGYVRGRAPDKTTGIRQDASARTAGAGPKDEGRKPLGNRHSKKKAGHGGVTGNQRERNSYSALWSDPRTLMILCM